MEKCLGAISIWSRLSSTDISGLIEKGYFLGVFFGTACNWPRSPKSGNWFLGRHQVLFDYQEERLLLVRKIGKTIKEIFMAAKRTAKRTKSKKVSKKMEEKRNAHVEKGGSPNSSSWTYKNASRKDFDRLRNMPAHQSNRAGSLRMNRGEITKRVGSQTMIMWDVAMNCLFKECPFYERCPYVVKWRNKYDSEGRTKKCRAQIEYTNTIYRAMMDRFDAARITDEQVAKIGLQIIPLYTQLFKMKMIEYSLGYDKVAQFGAKGGISIHPVYKEIRELIKTINSVWKGVGSENIKNGRKSSKDVKEDVEGFGDTSFYKMMMEGEEIDNGKPQWDDPPDEGEGLDLESEKKKKPKKKKKEDTKPKKKKKYSKSSKKVEPYIPTRSYNEHMRKN